LINPTNWKNNNYLTIQHYSRLYPNVPKNQAVMDGNVTSTIWKTTWQHRAVPQWP